MLKNIIIVCDYGYIEGGAARIAHETATALSKRNYNVFFFCAVGPVSEKLINSGVNVICLNQTDILHEKNRFKGILRGLSNRKAKREFARLLRGLNPEETVIHVHTWTKAVSSSIFRVAKKKKFRIFITVHDYFLICPNGGLFNYKSKSICELSPMSAKCVACNCDARSYPQKLFRVLRQKIQNRNILKNKNISYIFISEFSKIEFLKRYNKFSQERLFYLPNMVSFGEDRYRVECEKNDVYLFIGGLTEVKGIRRYCEAVAQTGVKAVVIGQGMLREELENKYPDIEFVGWKSKAEMLEYYKCARCLIFPSVWYETFGLTPLEVMAYGIPVICSDLNAASGFIADGETGLIFDGKSDDDLIEKINQTQDDLLVKNLSENVYKSFDAKQYSIHNYIEGLLKIFV